jgi:hypothetical protein
MASTTRIETSVTPPKHGAGGAGLRRHPRGTMTSMGRKQPLLKGTSGPSSWSIALNVDDSVLPYEEFTGPSACGLVPV